MFGEEGGTKGAQAEDVGNALYVPAFGEHVDADDATNVLPGHAFLAYGVDDVAEDGLAAFFGIEDTRVDANGDPASGIIVIGVVQEVVIFTEMFEEPFGALSAIGDYQKNGGGALTHDFEGALPFFVIFAPVGVDAGDSAFAAGKVFFFGFGVFDGVPEIEVDVGFFLGVRQADNLDQAGFEGIVDGEIGDQPLEESAFGFGGTGAIPGGGGEVDYQADAGGLVDASDNFAPFDVIGIFAFLGALFAIDMMGFIIDNHYIAPAFQEAADTGVGILAGAALHGPEDRGGDEATFALEFVGDPVITLGIEGDGLPVAD